MPELSSRTPLDEPRYRIAQLQEKRPGGELATLAEERRDALLVKRDVYRPRNGQRGGRAHARREREQWRRMWVNARAQWHSMPVGPPGIDPGRPRRGPQLVTQPPRNEQGDEAIMAERTWEESVRRARQQDRVAPRARQSMDEHR